MAKEQKEPKEKKEQKEFRKLWKLLDFGTGGKTMLKTTQVA